MTKREELTQKVIELFYKTLDVDAMRRKSYCNNDYQNSFNLFQKKVEQLGLKYGKCYHANGIGNNNEYPILLVEYDQDGFLVEREVCKFFYMTGIYGGVEAFIRDYDGTNLAHLGRAS